MGGVIDKEYLDAIRDEISYLSDGIERGIITSVRAAEECTLKKEEYVNSIHNGKFSEISKRRKNGTVYTLIATRPNGSRNYIRAKSREDMIDKLYKYYTGIGQSSIIEDVFINALKWKSETKVSGKSIQEYKRTWDKYYKEEDFVKNDIKTASQKDWKNFFKSLCKKYKLTQKQFSNIRIPSNILMSYCIDEGILPYNLIRDISYDDFDFKDEETYNNIKSKPFTDKQTNKIIEWCKLSIKDTRRKPIYPLAILFNLNEGLRFGELAGLKWDDIDFNKKIVVVSKQVVRDVNIGENLEIKYNGTKTINHLKGRVKPKPIPLTDYAIYILKEIKALNLSDEYVFPRGNFRYHTYNEKIKEAAGYAGANPEMFHTHCIRATVATNIYKNTHDIKQVQYVLRHTTPAMSEKYVDDWWALDAARDAMNSIVATTGDYF